MFSDRGIMALRGQAIARHCQALLLLQDLHNAILPRYRGKMARAPPTVTPYEILKSRLLQSYDLTDYQRAEQLINLPNLGDRRPSQLMSSMLALLPEGYSPDFLFNFLFLQRVPADVRGHLVTKKFENSRDLAAEADKLWVSRRQAPIISSVTAEARPVDVAAEDEILGIRQPKNSRWPLRATQPTQPSGTPI